MNFIYTYTVAPKIDRTAHTIFMHHCFFVNEPALRETVFIIVFAMVSCLFDLLNNSFHLVYFK